MALMVAAAVCLTACTGGAAKQETEKEAAAIENGQQGEQNGSQGEEQASTPEGQKGKTVTPEEFLAAKTEYIGDASAVGNLVELAKQHFGISQEHTLELHTDSAPYGVTLHFSERPDTVSVERLSAVLISLIGNCSSVSWDYPMDEQGNRDAYYLAATEAGRLLEGEQYIKEYAESAEDVKTLLELADAVSEELPAKVRAASMDEAVAAAILEHNRDGYQAGETAGEGHRILDSEETEHGFKVYAQTMYGNYQFQNGNFVKNAGSGVIPAVITLRNDPDGAFQWEWYQEPLDGGDFADSVKKMFPEQLWNVCLGYDQLLTEELTKQEQGYAAAYLKSIGREAAVGNYGDFEYTSLTDAGVSVEISNALLERGKYDSDSLAVYAPDWIGTVERLEDGMRYLYECSYDQQKKEIVYLKMNYDTGEILDRVIYDAETAERKDAAEAASVGRKEDATVRSGSSGVAASAGQSPEPEKVDYAADDYENWNALLQENEISDQFRQSLEQFAWESGSRILSGAETNGNYSPVSLYYALALAGCGAEGETASQILKGLGADSQQELSEQCRKLYQWYVYRGQWDAEAYKKYSGGDFKSKISLGNSLWVSDKLNMKEEFRKTAARDFFAPAETVDFSDPAAGKWIGKWIAEKTEGVLEPEMKLDPDTMLAIINTLYFYGGWTTPFSADQTETDTFTLENGAEISCPFMNRTDISGRFIAGNRYTAACLDTNNHCQMVFWLPDRGRTVGEFLTSPEAFRQIMDVDFERWTSGKVTWKVPKFSFGSSYQLQTLLSSMGMDRMFGGQAEFGNISDKPLRVSQVMQETHIGIDEQGVEGAAYTMIAMESMGMLNPALEAEMILDRPFLFGIRDSYNDVWLFLGVCRNPGA